MRSVKRSSVQRTEECVAINWMKHWNMHVRVAYSRTHRNVTRHTESTPSTCGICIGKRIQVQFRDSRFVLPLSHLFSVRLCPHATLARSIWGERLILLSFRCYNLRFDAMRCYTCASCIWFFSLLCYLSTSVTHYCRRHPRPRQCHRCALHNDFYSAALVVHSIFENIEGMERRTGNSRLFNRSEYSEYISP